MKKRKDGRFQRLFTINGKRICFYSSEDTEKKAMRDIEKQMLRYKEKEEHGKTFEEVAEEWDTHYRTVVPEITYQKSIKCAYNRILNHFSDDYVKDITPKDIDIFIKSLKYSQKTVSNHKSIINMIFSYGVVNGYIEQNPAREIKVPKGLPRNKRALPTTHELQVVSSDYKGFALLPFLMLYTGCRKSEALALTSDCIDRKNKIIKIRNHVVHMGNRPIFEPVLKSDAAKRDIILLDRLEAAIPKKFSGFLFSMNGDGKEPLTKRAYDKRWKKYCADHKINITAHQLRHGYATMLYEAGIGIKDAQELMGHADINLTRSVYTHVRDVRRGQTANQLNNFTFLPDVNS